MARFMENGESDGAVTRLAKELAELPGIGPKSADRITHFLLHGDRKNAVQLATALMAVVEKIHPCRQCFNHAELELCPICTDPRRDPGLICVVETPRDLELIERTGSFRGLYHVLGGKLAPLDGIGPDKLTYDELKRRVSGNNIREIILATSPTLEGDGTALFASNILSSCGVKLTRLARGLPSGTSLDLVNAQMLQDAIEGRRDL